MESPKTPVSPYLYFGSLYSIGVGILYLWGYWGTFDVNVLEYLNLADVLKLTVYPIASVFVFYALGVLLGEFMFVRTSLTPGAGRDTLIGRFLNRFISSLFLLWVLGTVVLFLYGPESKWLLLPLLIGLPVYFAAKQ